MGRKANIDRMPVEIKSYIQAMLATGSQTLDEMVKDLKLRFPAEFKAGELPSRSALHRYGAKLDRRLMALKASTEAAVLIREHAGDSLDARSEALTALVQTEMFDAIIELQDAADEDVDPADRLAMLSKAAKNIATLSRSSVNLKKFQAEVEDKARRELQIKQEANLQEVAKAQGMDEDQVNFWRRKVLEIA